MSERRRWERETLKPWLARHPERAEALRDDRARLHAPDDMADWDYRTHDGFPGRYPFTRGVQPTAYRGRLWTMRQYAGFGTAAESNARYRYLLGQGQTGLSVAFDLPTQIGYDSDHALARGEVGKVGVAIDSVRDMGTLFDRVPLDRVSTSMTINSPAAVLLAMYATVGKRQGADPAALRGTIQNDVLKEYVARGTYIFPPRESLRLTTDIFAHCAKAMPKWNTISISGYHIREAGATAAQELAFTLANGVTYVQAAVERGLPVDSFAPRLAFFFNAHNDLLEEVAKFRAARLLWAELMRDRFEARDPRSWTLRFHTQTAGSTLTAQQPHNNVVRVAVQALSAVLGGTQSLHTNSMDEALGLPSKKAARVALRTQQVIAHESGVANTIDPLAGSYTIETLTGELADDAKALMAKIDAMGGVLAAIEKGWIQAEIAESAYRHQQQVERDERIVVGVNRYLDAKGEKLPDLLKVDEAAAQAQADGLARLRRERGDIESHLAALAEAAEGDANLLPHITRAVEAEATLGEVCDTLRGVWGEYRARGGV